MQISSGKKVITKQDQSPFKAFKPICAMTSPISAYVIGVDVIGPGDPVDGGQGDSGVVVGDHVRIAVLRLVLFHLGVLPCERLAGINRLEQEVNESWARSLNDV